MKFAGVSGETKPLIPRGSMGKPAYIIMQKLIATTEQLDRKFAFVKGNREINEKAVSDKAKSIRDQGQLSPITIVKGEEVSYQGGHLIDLDGRDIPDEQAENYYAVIDGQHRLMAFLKIGLNLDDLAVTEPLNPQLSITVMIAEMNICTKSWNGTDYLAAPCMALNIKNNEVFDFALELRRKKYPLSSISLWCIGKNSMKPKDFVTCVKDGKLPKAFEDKTWYQRSIKWYKAA